MLKAQHLRLSAARQHWSALVPCRRGSASDRCCLANVAFGSKPEKLNKSKCFPLFTQQRTSPRYFGMSVSWLTLFDHLVGDGKKARLQFQIERAGGFQIH